MTAVLGPTNTGKTHLAIERMLGAFVGRDRPAAAAAGARGLRPRRRRVKGADAVALITGEEKIVPRSARYCVCTVESMPPETDASFLAIDEVQLAADLERGHIFTDRILHRARPRRDAAPRRGDDAAESSASWCRGIDIVDPPALFGADLCRLEEDHAAAAPFRRGRVLGRRGLRDRPS